MATNEKSSDFRPTTILHSSGADKFASCEHKSFMQECKLMTEMTKLCIISNPSMTDRLLCKIKGLALLASRSYFVSHLCSHQSETKQRC